MAETCQNRQHRFCVGRDEAAMQIETEPNHWWLLLPKGSMDSDSTAEEQLWRLAAGLKWHLCLAMG